MARIAKVGNILDEIHAELDPLVWDNPMADQPTLKPVHAHWIKSHVYKTLEDGGYTGVEKWLTLVLTGSLTTYQYSTDSDVDISLFVDTKIFPEWSRAEMIALMVDKLDGTTLPGTPFPLQDFVVGEGIKPSDLYKPGLRSGYNIDNGKWIVPPERNRAHDVKAREGGFYAWALQMADKMERLLRYEPDQAIAFWHSIHKKRREDMVKGKGDFSASNIIYKMLANRGLFPQISQVSGEYIARRKQSALPNIMYHGTADPEGVEMTGLDVGSYLAADPELARYYAETTAEDHGGTPAVYAVHGIDPAQLSPDWPALEEPVGYGARKSYDMLDAIEAHPKQWRELDAGDSIDLVGSARHEYPIPPERLQRFGQIGGEHIAKKAPELPNYKAGGMDKHCSNCKIYDHGESGGYIAKTAVVETLSFKPIRSWGDGEKALGAYIGPEQVAEVQYTQENPHTYVDSLSVSNKHQRKGYATALMDELARVRGHGREGFEGDFTGGTEDPEGTAHSFWNSYFAQMPKKAPGEWEGEESWERRTAGAPIKPPRLRQGTPTKNCLSCKMYHKNSDGRGKCWGYGEHGVRADQLCDSYQKETRSILSRIAAHALQYDRDRHPEGKGFILDDGSVWTWPTDNLKPMHMQYSMKVKQQGQQVAPGSAFHIKEGKVWQYGPGRSLTSEQQQAIFAADPKLEMTPSRRQEQLDATPGFGHGQNVLDILERESAWVFQSSVDIPEIQSQS